MFLALFVAVSEKVVPQVNKHDDVNGISWKLPPLEMKSWLRPCPRLHAYSYSKASLWDIEASQIREPGGVGNGRDLPGSFDDPMLLCSVRTVPSVTPSRLPRQVVYRYISYFYQKQVVYRYISYFYQKQHLCSPVQFHPTERWYSFYTNILELYFVWNEKWPCCFLSQRALGLMMITHLVH